MIPTNKIYLSPWTKSEGDVSLIIIEVVQFERQSTNTIFLNVRLSVISEKADQFLLKNKSVYREATKDKSYQETVSAMSRALLAFSYDLAEEIKKTNKK